MNNGLVILKIGSANPGDFSAIDWSNGPYFVKIDYDLNNGTAFTDTDPVQILSVPYALYAEKAGSSENWVNIGDSILFSTKRVGIGTLIDAPPDVLLQINSQQEQTSFLLGSYAPQSTSLRFSTTAFQNGKSEIQAVKASGSAWGNLILNPSGGSVGVNTKDNTPTGALTIRGDLTFMDPIDANFSGGSVLRFDYIPSFFPGSGAKGFRMVARYPYSTGYNSGPRAIVVGFDGNTLLGTNENGISLGNVGIGTNSPTTKLDVNGPAKAHCLTISGGCDWYEEANAQETIQPGEVTVIDPSNGLNSVKRSARAYDPRVTGVVSGAGGVNPGIGLTQEGIFKGNTKVAMGGKVMVKVVGKVKPGDILTSSNKPGHAMVAKNRRKGYGTVIGKALSAPNEEGLVLMMVMMR